MPKLNGYECRIDGIDDPPYIAMANTASKARYKAWLDISDSWEELNMIEIKVRRAPSKDMIFPDLPDVNSELNDADRETILNAFGGGDHVRPEHWGHRCYQCLAPDDQKINRLVKLGIFNGPHGVDERGDTPGWCGAFYYLTDDGKELARALIGARECA